MSAERGEAPAGRYVPLAVWLIALAVLIGISLKIFSYDYLPGGDARRHIAKAFTDKPYTEILVLRPEYAMDHSPGWEWLLKTIRRMTDWNADTLAGFSVVFLMLCVFLAPLPWLRRPEAWIAALLAQMVAIPELMTRLTQARPYLVTEGVLIAILFSWSKRGERISFVKVLLTSIGIALSVWIHGAWYLWALPLAAFLLAGAWRRFVSLSCCVGAGLLLGAVMTGRPLVFLREAIDILVLVSREHVPQWMLVGELRPSEGEFATLALLGLVYLVTRRGAAPEPGLFSQPVFWMIVICWVLGFKADRFWADWGVPAALTWMTWRFEAFMEIVWTGESPRRVLISALAALALFWDATNDLDRRYSSSHEATFLNGADPALKGWLPDDGGIIYSAHMECFYNTFYANPQATWRYILGLEPALMPPDDLKIFRAIQASHFAYQAYQPWVDKMRPDDRLIIVGGGKPPLEQLEWANAGNFWIGRPLPAKAK